MSSEHQPSQIPGGENNFEAIYQRRIMELEQKVNKYCAEYDALMNLLPIGNNLTSVLSFQKDFTQISSKIDSLDEKISTLNEREIDIDKNYWEQSYKELQKMVKHNQKQLNKVQKTQKQEQVFDDSVNFQTKLNQKLKTHEETISSKLARHKNNIELKKHVQSQTTEGQVLKLIDRKINSFYEPILGELEEIEEQIDIARLKVPLREVEKFHEFTYHRLMNQMLETDQTLEQIYATYQGESIRNGRKLAQKIEQLGTQIELFHYQIQGSRNKCLNDLLTHQLSNYSPNNTTQTHKNMIKDYEQLRNNLQQLQSKFKILKKYPQNC